MLYLIIKQREGVLVMERKAKFAMNTISILGIIFFCMGILFMAFGIGFTALSQEEMGWFFYGPSAVPGFHFC